MPVRDTGPMTQDLRAVPWPVRTARLALRPATADDLDTLWRIRRRPAVDEWLGHDVGDGTPSSPASATPTGSPRCW